MNKEDFEAIRAAHNLAVAHIIENGCDDIFKPPLFSHSIEWDIIKSSSEDFKKASWGDCLEFLKNCELARNRIGVIYHSLVVKDQFTFRKVSWIDPFDLIKYLSACILLFEAIEKRRIPAVEEVVHSHRRSRDGSSLFDEEYGYTSFRKKSGDMSRARIGQWKVVTDIANFFDRIGNHPLENHLLNSNCDARYVSLVRDILYFWAGDRRSFGVPVGSDASRILCEAALINVDSKLKEADVVFLRYVDDIRIFAATRAEAYKGVQLLTTLLAEEGLSLNSRKTRVYQIKDDDELVRDPNLQDQTGHDIIDLSAVVPVLLRTVVSGRTTLSKFYKKPGEDALRSLKKIDKSLIRQEIIEASDDAFEEIVKKAVKYFVYVDSDTALLRDLLYRRITSVFYIVDAVIKEGGRFSPSKREEIKNTIIAGVEPESGAYPLQIPIFRLFGSPGYEDSRLITSLVDSHRLGDNLLFLREAITLNYRQLDRARIRTLALEHFRNVPNFVRRAIFLAVKDAPQLSEDERRPLLKNMLQATDDWFIGEMAKTTLTPATS